MPEPIQSVASNSCEYDPSNEVSRAPAAATPASTPANDPAPPPTASQPGVELLLGKHPPHASAGQCVNEKAALILAGGALIRSAGAMAVTSPTLVGEIPAITAFIASAIAVGATAATYLSCSDEAKKSPPP